MRNTTNESGPPFGAGRGLLRDARATLESYEACFFFFLRGFSSVGIGT